MLNDSRDVLLVLLGWSLGTLSPSIQRAILRQRRRAELLRGLAYECHELRFTLACALYSTRRSLRAFDQSTLDLLEPLLLNYHGAGYRDVTPVFATILAEPDAQLLSWANDEQTQRRDAHGRPLIEWPNPHSLPLLAVHIANLDLLRMSEQERPLRIDAELRLFNEQVAYVRLLHERASTTSGPNYQINQGNYQEARRTIGNREEELIRAIDRLIEPSGSLRHQ